VLFWLLYSSQKACKWLLVATIQVHKSLPALPKSRCAVRICSLLALASQVITLKVSRHGHKSVPHFRPTWGLSHFSCSTCLSASAKLFVRFSTREKSTQPQLALSVLAYYTSSSPQICMPSIKLSVPFCERPKIN